ncbi:MAG: hypothetical protein K2J87_07320, partial [Muribaculaceae bacterium]|nr:hypothetical protein [Muribaculaceae bacterium]
LFPIMVNPAITKVEATDIPAIPAEFDVTVSDDNVTVEQDQDTDGANIVLLGETSAETVTVTLAVPEGWDGYYCAVWGEDSGEEGGDTPTPFARKRVNALADEETEYIMMPLEELTAEMPLKEGNSVTLKVDEESISAGIFFLYKGENALYWPIAVNPSITKIEGEDIPALPEEYVVTVDPSENVEIAQDPSEDIYGWIVPHTIAINGKCEQKTATITIEVPEGWDNFIWKCDDISPYDSRKKANKTVWEDKADLIADGYTEGNVIEVPVDSRSHIYYLYPCLGDKIDSANDIQLDVMFNKFFPGLVFPEELDVTLSSEGPKVEQASEEWAHTITITGDCEGETLTVTIAVPEGWDGIIGATDADVEEGPEINPLSTRAAEEENLIFMPLEVVENGDVPLKKSNEFAFAADGTEHYGMAYLYKEDMACFKQIDITVAVNDKLAGISNIEGADSEARFFNLQGVEVANPENGVYVKVANGKASKVTVK